jgi:hypothetical protein
MDLSIGHKLEVKVEHISQVLPAMEQVLAGPRPPWVPLGYGEAANEKKSAEREILKKLGSTGRPGRR